MARKDSTDQHPLRDTIPIEFLVQAIDNKISFLHEAKHDWTLRLIPISDDQSLDESAIHTRIYRDMLSNHHIVGRVENYQGFLLRKTLPELFLSLFMLGITCTAFMLTYRNSQRQQRLSEMKTDLISNITHELQTPIATVKVALEALDSATLDADPDKKKEYLKISRHEVDRLSLLVDNVLQQSVQSPGLPIMEKFDLKVMVEQVVEMMSVRLEEKNASISIEAGLTTYPIAANKSQLESVLYNLLDNALKYSTETIKIVLRLSRKEGQIHLQMEDNGIGIPHAYQGKIFDRFFRVPTGDRHDVKGYGLGLSQVKNIINSHRGNISVVSVAGKGSTFRIQLPAVT